METLKRHGPAPYKVAVLHGGPGGAGEVAPVARELGRRRGVLEPLQTELSIDGQIVELRAQLESAAELPVVLIGWSWGAWLAWIFAARFPHLVLRLILVGSGPFDESYLDDIEAARAGRLSPEERAEARMLLRSSGEDRRRNSQRLAYLMDKQDAYDPMHGEPCPIDFDSGIFASVWPEAAELRRSGALLDLGRQIQCPIFAIHGREDPHPADGVRIAVESVAPNLKFILLERCGHKPWIERHASHEFYLALEAQLAG